VTQRRVAAGAIAVACVACASQHADAVKHYSELACKTSSDESAIAAAVRGYIRQAAPQPQRFLYIPDTDSSPPEPAVQELQATGPTYMYSSVPAQQAAVDKQLESVGDYPTLLLAYHGFARTDPLHPVVKLSGHFVSGSNNGTPVAARTIALQCDSAGWSVPPVPAGHPAPPVPSAATHAAPGHT
jgi:hypothetical protein